jgi:hypothetical protein
MKKAILCFLLLVLVGGTAAQSVGVAPAYLNLGTIPRGSTEEATIYVTSSSPDPFNVNPDLRRPFSNRIFGGTSYIDPSKYSEEDIDEWVEFRQEIYTVRPDDPQVVALEDGTMVSAAGNVTMYVNVPEDAEPGYHAGRVRLSPQTSSGTGYGAQVVAQAVTNIAFRVPGNVERNVQLMDVNAYRVRENAVRLDVKLRNRGTVTTSVNATRFLIENFVGENLESISGQSMTLEPRESQWFTTFWTGEEVEGGEYTVKGSVDYMTGSSFTQKTFSIGDTINVTAPEQPPQPGQEQEQEPLPGWLVIMFLALVGVLMYSFEIDPMWILATITFLGVSVFIFLSDVPNYLILVLLTTAGLILYIGWK